MLTKVQYNAGGRHFELVGGTRLLDSGVTVCPTVVSMYLVLVFAPQSAHYREGYTYDSFLCSETMCLQCACSEARRSIRLLGVQTWRYTYLSTLPYFSYLEYLFLPTLPIHIQFPLQIMLRASLSTPTKTTGTARKLSGEGPSRLPTLFALDTVSPPVQLPVFSTSL